VNQQPSNRQQARSDERDNSRVLAFGVIVAVVVLIGALMYFYAVDKRGEGPAHETAPPAGQTSPAPAAPQSPAPAAPAK